MTPTAHNNASSADDSQERGKMSRARVQQEEFVSCERLTAPQIPSQKETPATQCTVAVAANPSRLTCQEGGKGTPDNLEALGSQDSREKHKARKRSIASLSSAAHREDTTAGAAEKKDEACVLSNRAAIDDLTQSKRHKVEEITDLWASTGAPDYTSALDAEKQTRDLSSITNGQELAADIGQQACSAHGERFDGANSMQREEPCSAGAKPEAMYQNSWILAPMVRITTLPFRLESLKYGADLVYSEEIVDKKLLDSKRHINKDFGTIEYICRSDGRCVFSTCEEERGKVVLQLGTANASLALQAANAVLQDIAAVDVNMGCPKSFSVKGGMGAALLSTPDVAMDILKTLRRNISCPVTCKTRLLDTMEETVDFARKCESTGITAIAVHARKRHERPAHRANWQAFPILRDTLKIPLIANGDFLTAQDAMLFQDSYGIYSLMFARGAMWDPSLFAHKPALNGRGKVNYSLTRLDVLQDYIKRAVRCGAVYQSIKFTLQEMTGRDSNKELKQNLIAANSTAKICSVFGLDGFYNSINHVPLANTLNYYKNIDLL
ncbi:hypothetical protein Esti_001770 [Eimeria stiedai]